MPWSEYDATARTCLSTFGANQDDVPLAALAAVLAVVAVIAAGVLARAPLARVPENSMKLGVVVTLGAIALVAAVGAPAWWIAPIAVLAILHRSVGRAVS